MRAKPEPAPKQPETLPQMPLDWEDVLTTKEVAKMLRVSIESVHRWIQRGKLIAARRNGRYLIPRRAALAMLERVEPGKELLRPSYVDTQTRARLARFGL